MDPNSLMRDMLHHLQVVNDPNTSPPTRATHAEWLAERFEQLDTWLITGGFLPSRWAPPRATTVEDVQRELVGDPWRAGTRL